MMDLLLDILALRLKKISTIGWEGGTAPFYNHRSGRGWQFATNEMLKAACQKKFTIPITFRDIF